MWGRGGVEREGDTESEAAPGPELSAQSPTRGSNSRTVIMTWAEVRCLTDWATQAPQTPYLMDKETEGQKGSLQVIPVQLRIHIPSLSAWLGILCTTRPLGSPHWIPSHCTISTLDLRHERSEETSFGNEHRHLLSYFLVGPFNVRGGMNPQEPNRWKTSHTARKGCVNPALKPQFAYCKLNMVCNVLRPKICVCVCVCMCVWKCLWTLRINTRESANVFLKAKN